MSDKQKNMWKKHTVSMYFEELIEAVKKPAIFQVELKEILDKYAKENVEIIEVGCETGISSLILSEKFNKTLLDLNPDALELAKKLFKEFNQKANFVEADMFQMPFDDEKFDIVFNAGVIEHFKKKEVIAALKEYKRILKKDGVMIIGFPNYRSIPYQSALLISTFLGRWPFPKAYNYYDLKREIKTAGLILEKREVLSKKSIYNWWNFSRTIKKIFEKTDPLFNWEGYLTLLTIKRSHLDLLA